MDNIDTLVSKYLVDRYGVTLNEIDTAFMNNETAEEWIESQLVMDDDITSHHEMISIDKELGLVSVAAFKASLTHRTAKDKISVYSCNDKIKLAIEPNGKVVGLLGGQAVKGMKRLALYQYMLQISGWENCYETDTGWRIFEIKWNGNIYNIGYMIDSPVASFMSKKKSNMTPDRYYRSYHNQKSYRTPTQPVKLQEDHEVYGPADASLGSIYTDPIRDELLEAVETVLRCKDLTFTRDIIDSLADDLGVETEMAV